LRVVDIVGGQQHDLRVWHGVQDRPAGLGVEQPRSVGERSAAVPVRVLDDPAGMDHQPEAQPFDGGDRLVVSGEPLREDR